MCASRVAIIVWTAFGSLSRGTIVAASYTCRPAHVCVQVASRMQEVFERELPARTKTPPAASLPRAPRGSGAAPLADAPTAPRAAPTLSTDTVIAATAGRSATAAHPQAGEGSDAAAGLADTNAGAAEGGAHRGVIRKAARGGRRPWGSGPCRGALGTWSAKAANEWKKGARPATRPAASSDSSCNVSPVFIARPVVQKSSGPSPYMCRLGFRPWLPAALPDRVLGKESAEAAAMSSKTRSSGRVARPWRRRRTAALSHGARQTDGQHHESVGALRRRQGSACTRACRCEPVVSSSIPATMSRRSGRSVETLQILRFDSRRDRHGMHVARVPVCWQRAPQTQSCMRSKPLMLLWTHLQVKNPNRKACSRASQLHRGSCSSVSESTLFAKRHALSWPEDL